MITNKRVLASNCRFIHFASKIFLVGLIFTFILLPQRAFAVPSDVYVDPPTKTVNLGDSFILNVLIDSHATNIAAAQADISFNPAIIKINSITEGNLLTQGGATTFFFISKGIDNLTGKAGTVACTILGPSNVSTKEAFFIINATSLTTGTSVITLSNVKISDALGNIVPSTTTNGSVTVLASLDTIVSSNQKIKVYPNPYIKGKSPGEKITFANLPKEAAIKIYSNSGKLIKELSAGSEDKAEWSITDVSGGIYLYVITSTQGTKKGKVSIIK